MSLDALKEKVCQAMDDEFLKMQEVGTFLYNHPELGNEEYESTAFLAEVLKKEGFEVTYPYAGVETAIRADFKNGDGPVVAFLAEYDALPGYGPNRDENAHACGHNWIAATCFGACLALKACSSEFKGTISFIGAPAEETVGGKIDVINNGGYSDVNYALQFHLGGEKTNLYCQCLAMDSLEFTFHGVASHAAGNPEDGINALDAVNLTFTGINCLRQHVKSDVRMHGIVTAGGTAVNTVPDLCQARFYVRSATREYLNIVKEKVINIAKGAALMTGCTMEYRYFENPFDNLVNDDKLRDLMRTNLENLGVTDFCPPGAYVLGSSDIGNVSRLFPTLYVEMATGFDNTVTAHKPEFLKAVIGEKADKTMAIAAKAMAMTAIDLFN